MKDAAVQIKHVSMEFGEECVLHDISHEFEKARIHGVIGNNGSGKTVLFKCICGFLRPTRGEILVGGKRIGKDVDFPERIGIIIETPGFLGGISGFKNLQLLASLKAKIGAETIRSTMERVGLDPGLKKPVAKYSLGMRQRLGIAQAIMEAPEFLILDEPFNGLDKKGVSDMRELIKELRKKEKTILITSHNAADIEALCDTVCEMDAGVLSVMSG